MLVDVHLYAKSLCRLFSVRAMEGEVGAEKEFSGVSLYKDTNPIGLGPYSYDLI